MVAGFGTPLSRSRDRATPEAEENQLEAALTAAREGDENGFAILWRDLHPRLLRYLRARGDAAPEDVAAEAWIQVMRGLAGFRGGAAEFRAWVFTIARNRAIDQGRARTRRPSVPVADPAAVMGESATVPSAEEHAEENESLSWALRLVATLPPAQAEMVTLRVVAGLDVADVARMLGKRPGTVRVGVHRGLRTLARTAAEDEWRGKLR